MMPRLKLVHVSKGVLTKTKHNKVRTMCLFLGGVYFLLFFLIFHHISVNISIVYLAIYDSISLTAYTVNIYL